ncbi:MAG: aspartate--tRNA(Asn) ligase [Candidatus Micrarchaeia archaeon]
MMKIKDSKDKSFNMVVDDNMLKNTGESNTTDLSKRVTTAALTEAKFGSKVVVAGYIKRIRTVSANLAFVLLADQYGEVQLTCKSDSLKNIKDIQKFTRHSFIVAEGTLVKGQAKVGMEIEATKLELLTDKPAQPLPIELEKVNTGLETRLNYRWIDLRDTKHRIPIIMLSKITAEFRNFLTKEAFIEIFSPKFTGYPTEGGSEVFSVDYFGRKAYLAQSPQFYKQMAICSGLEKVFEIAPVFRANPSFTSRHDTEFTSFDLEMAYITSHHDVMTLEERMLNHAIKGLLRTSSAEIAQVTNNPLNEPGKIPRVKMEEAYQIVSKNNITPEGDLNPDGERELAKYIKNETGNDFVFVTDYPWAARPFYHMLGEPMSDGTKTTKSFDLIFRGVEITTGAQREHNYDKLVENAKAKGLNTENLQYYLDFFKYGAPPHGGFGFGLTRIVTQMLDLENVRESTLVPRDPKRLRP